MVSSPCADFETKIKIRQFLIKSYIRNFLSKLFIEIMASVVTNAAVRCIVKSGTRSSGTGHSATAGHGGGYALWQKLAFFVGLPAVALGMVNAFVLGEHDHSQPEFVPYEHLRIRTKRFPWGDGQHSLFHNPHVNALPSGYEQH